MPKALVIYATRAGETEKIAALIAEGLRMAGVEADQAKAADIKSASQLEGYDALVLGSPTYHGDMLQTMKTLLFTAEKADLKGCVGGAFGAFGWSGEAPGRIHDTLRHIFQMSVTSDPLRLKSTALGGGIQMAQDYGRAIAKMITP